MANHPPYWLWKNVLSLKEIKRLNKLIMSNYSHEEEKNQQARHPDGRPKKNVKTYVIPYRQLKEYISKLVDKAYDANLRAYNFDLWPYGDEDNCLYNIYSGDEKAGYDWHVDMDNNPYVDIKLTLNINLSEKPFEGGDLILQMTNDIKVPEWKERGSMIFFKPHSRHKVTPVTKGERRNLILFIKGPNFK
jgi:hypothetical protein|tara:strand:+ start:4631 stop:5200 length:570 start_codon:yes stop_codon:yes gene_type:complete